MEARTVQKLHFPKDTPSGTPVVTFIQSEGELYFTTVGDQRNSIECADLIVHTIFSQTGTSPGNLRVFDLQTHMGYVDKESGWYQCDELLIEPGGRVWGFKRGVACPQFILKAFASLIGRPGKI